MKEGETPLHASASAATSNTSTQHATPAPSPLVGPDGKLGSDLFLLGLSETPGLSRVSTANSEPTGSATGPATADFKHLRVFPSDNSGGSGGEMSNNTLLSTLNPPETLSTAPSAASSSSTGSTSSSELPQQIGGSTA